MARSMVKISPDVGQHGSNWSCEAWDVDHQPPIPNETLHIIYDECQESYTVVRRNWVDSIEFPYMRGGFKDLTDAVVWLTQHIAEASTDVQK